MKATRAILIALALLVLLAVPAFAARTSGFENDTRGMSDTGAGGMASTGLLARLVASEHLPDCDQDQIDLSVNGEPATAQFLIYANATNSGEPCHLNTDVTLTIENQAGETLEIQGNPATGNLHADVPSDEASARFIWENWCGEEDSFVLRAEGFGQTATNTIDSAPRCGAQGEPSRLSAFANEQSQGDNQQDESAAQPFELTLYGDVPEGETFRVGVAEENSFDFIALTFCGGPKPGTPPRPEDRKCEGSGTTFTQTLEHFPEGTTIKFMFQRETSDAAQRFDVETFHRGTTTVPTDGPIEGFFCFDGAEADVCDNEDANDQQIPEELPATGAGGMAGGMLPWGSVAGSLSLLALGWYALKHK